MPEITFEELEERLRDLDTPESELRPYFTADKARSQPFAPVLQVDRSKVELDEVDEFRVQGAFAMDWANSISRWRRQRRFERDKDRPQHAGKPVLVAEGDSWFQFPIFLDDVVDQLGAGNLVWCVSAAGDTLENMVLNAPEYVDAVNRQASRVKAFLFSGAGNDIVGKDKTDAHIIESVVRPFEAGRPASWYLETTAFLEKLAFIEDCYRAVLEEIERDFPELPVILHGYDRSIPGGFPGDPRRPRWADQDQWLGRAFRNLGIADHALQRQIVGLMIDRLNELLARLCGGNTDGGAFRSAYHVDVRGTLADVADWADELHPTDAGFKKVAQKFTAVLRQAGA